MCGIVLYYFLSFNYINRFMLLKSSVRSFCNKSNFILIYLASSFLYMWCLCLCLCLYLCVCACVCVRVYVCVCVCMYVFLLDWHGVRETIWICFWRESSQWPHTSGKYVCVCTCMIFISSYMICIVSSNRLIWFFFIISFNYIYLFYLLFIVLFFYFFLLHVLFQFFSPFFTYFILIVITPFLFSAFYFFLARPTVKRKLYRNRFPYDRPGPVCFSRRVNTYTDIVSLESGTFGTRTNVSTLMCT